jgi:hypothetical protein
MHNRDPGSSGPMKRRKDATGQGAAKVHGVTFQHFIPFGRRCYPGDQTFQLREIQPRGYPRHFLLDSGRASPVMCSGANQLP